MFLHADDIKKLRVEYPDPKFQNLIGQPIEYYFITHEGKGLCGMPCFLADMRLGDEGGDGPFFISLAVLTPVPEFFTLVKDLRVLFISVERQDKNDDRLAFVLADEVDAVTNFLADVYGEAKPPAKLALVHSKPE